MRRREEWATGHREWNGAGPVDEVGQSFIRELQPACFVHALFSGRVPTFYFIHFRFMT